MPYGRVYLLTNLINGKRYVGQTTRTVDKRFHEHFLGLNKNPIHLAIAKYGKDNFTLEILVESDNQKQLDLDEDFYILICSSMSPVGYNLKRGGGCGRLSPDQKAKMSGEGAPFFGKKHSLETRLKMRGRKFTDDHRAKLSAAANWPAERRKAHSEAQKGRSVPWMHGSNNPTYRADISTDALIAELNSGIGITALERKIGMSRAGIRKRVRTSQKAQG